MKNVNWLNLLGAVIAIVIISFGVQYGMAKVKTTSSESSQNLKTNDSSYYAVFLNNDQVYFGHLSGVNDQYITMTDIYYLQLAQSLQSGDQKKIDANNPDTKSQISLVKLGQEFHGPKDEMVVNRDNILFYEELKSDSKVIKTIAEDKAKK